MFQPEETGRFDRFRLGIFRNVSFRIHFETFFLARFARFRLEGNLESFFGVLFESYFGNSLKRFFFHSTTKNFSFRANFEVFLSTIERFSLDTFWYV